MNESQAIRLFIQKKGSRRHARTRSALTR